MKCLLKIGIAVLPSLLVGTLFAEVPQWWIARGVVDTNAASNDYAPVNQGQVKYVATQAYLELNQNLTNDCSAISNLVFSFSNTNNWLPANLGQLKAVAQPFYDLLWANNYTNAWPEGMTIGPYPWSGVSGDTEDYALANIGQLKYLFSFNLTAIPLDTDGDGLLNQDEIDIYGTNPFSPDTDGDEMPDGWEVSEGLNPLLDDAFNNPDNDLFSNKDEFDLGLNPFTNDMAVAGCRINYTYDALGRLTGTEAPESTDTTYVFDEEGNITGVQ